MSSTTKGTELACIKGSLFAFFQSEFVLHFFFVWLAGGAAIKKYAVLNDKRHILTLDTDNKVAIYDVLKVVKVKDLGPVDFDNELKQQNQKVYIPNWFTVDLKTGVSLMKRAIKRFLYWTEIFFSFEFQMPTIVLGQDEVDCFAAWVSAEAGLPEHVDPGSDLKVKNVN